MILEAIVFLTAAFTGDTCAGIDNRQNKAVYAGPNTPLTSTVYHEDGDGWIVYPDAPAPDDLDGWRALHEAEYAVWTTPPGPKVYVRCTETGA